ncbi:MaoC family dehydratase N-terminal domain-containing protein [Streptomyces sp. NPDC047315]|uniref:MaoC family dehydratase N-terminal domain-containing protein n=1 Tax=Streptomyces sp. NPDC047315 TaxID=3155142 RepID=UPI0033BFCE9F
MPIDPSIVGTRTAEHTVEVERGRLRFFAKATGQADPVYTDVEAAKAAGHRDLPVPPTFLFCLNMEEPHTTDLLQRIGVDLRTILHGSQGFTYHSLVHAGDTLTFSTSITDVYAKKGGALEFIVRTTEVTRDGDLVAELAGAVVVRNPEAAK